MEKKKNGCINTTLVNTELFPVSLFAEKIAFYFRKGLHSKLHPEI